MPLNSDSSRISDVDAVIPVRQGALLVVLMLAMAMAPFVTYAISALGPMLVTELQVPPARFGLFATAGFLSAALSSRIFARSSDRLPDARLMAIICGCSAIALALFAGARDFNWILVAAVLTGPAHALSNPLTNRIIASRVPSERRTQWMGIKQSGVQCSQALAGLAVPVAAAIWGWRISLAVLALVTLALFLWSRSKLPQTTVRKAEAVEPSLSLPFPRRIVWAYAAYALFSGAGLQATNVYLPLFARQALEFSPVLSGFTVAVAGGIGLCARIWWGRVMMTGVDAGALLFRLALAAFCGVGCLVAAVQLQLPAMLWIGTLLHGATAIGSNVIIMIGVMRRVPPSTTGAASATVGIGMYLGFALGPLLMSRLLGSAESYTFAWCVVAGCYLGSAAVARWLR